MKTEWPLYAIGMVLLFVMIAFGMSLISQGQEGMTEEQKADPGYQAASTSTNLMLVGVSGIPWVIGILAVILVFAYLNRKY